MCVRACVRACMRACVRACVRACERACVCVDGTDEPEGCTRLAHPDIGSFRTSFNFPP